MPRCVTSKSVPIYVSLYSTDPDEEKRFFIDIVPDIDDEHRYVVTRVIISREEALELAQSIYDEICEDGREDEEEFLRKKSEELSLLKKRWAGR